MAGAMFSFRSFRTMDSDCKQKQRIWHYIQKSCNAHIQQVTPETCRKGTGKKYETESVVIHASLLSTYYRKTQ